MSVIHKIISKNPLDISRLNNFVSTINGAIFQNRGEGVFYYWIDGKSTRGFEITLEDNFIEVRNMAVSNRQDYELTNKIVEEILSITNGIIIDEQEEQVTIFPIWDNDKITETEIRDCEIIYSLANHEGHVGIDGPVRTVHFGKRLCKVFKSLKGVDLKNSIFDLILKVNYKIPNYEPGNVLLASKSEDDVKRMKVLTNETDCIIDKYDYLLMFISKKQNPIMVTNEILNTMLPFNWTLVDEFTVVAPITTDNEWKKLLKNAQKHDLWESVINQ